MTHNAEQPSSTPAAEANAATPESLSAITTNWPQLVKANQGAAGQDSPELNQLVLRYHAAALRCLLRLFPRHPEVADDLCQQFALKFKQGHFRKVKPEKGRFRDFLKKVLHNLVVDYYRQQKRQPGPMPEDMNDRLQVTIQEEWPVELLDHAWQGLAEVEQRRGTPYFTALRWCFEHPDEPLTVLAGQLREQRGKECTEAGVRQIVKRARDLFADFLRQEVARSIGASPAHPEDQDRIDCELAHLGLLNWYRRKRAN
jgi:RNA polymerase sigma-70 factor (ECF subfamily)